MGNYYLITLFFFYAREGYTYSGVEFQSIKIGGIYSRFCKYLRKPQHFDLKAFKIY